MVAWVLALWQDKIIAGRHGGWKPLINLIETRKVGRPMQRGSGIPQSHTLSDLLPQWPPSSSFNCEHISRLITAEASTLMI